MLYNFYVFWTWERFVSVIILARINNQVRQKATNPLNCINIIRRAEIL
jgi:hypothetical protein